MKKDKYRSKIARRGLEEDVGNYNNDLQYNFDTRIIQKDTLQAKRDRIAI